ncbi:hormone-sensitive lipase-like isoform X2 [Anoplolepis gracilipes]|uniref:hormone-sensitive lipase-like isoform X2 n=1 Tax=Anoplolepis gracilipes TaxID=354296 RepID=UPI003B9EE845
MSTINDNFNRTSENVESLQWNTLRKLCRASVEYFTSYRNKNSVRLKDALLVILEQLDELQPLYNEIAKFASHFDFDEETPGNGYRSFLTMVDKCIMYSEKICQKIYRQRNSMFSRKSRHIKKIEACCQLLVTLHICLQQLIILHTWHTEAMNDGKLSLFVMNRNPQEFLNLMENINQYCFYGRCIGFQFSSSLRNLVTAIMIAMASYSEKYYNNGTIFERCGNSINYLLDPEARARRIINISQYADILFLQAFWNLSELKILSIITPSLAVNQLISVPPKELILPTLDGGTVSVPIPNSHIGKKPIQLRLLSSKRRRGMINSENRGRELHDLSDGLIIHTHGGAFVAQTSQSHVTYLQKWATMLDVPILSIDYSLAPQAPYPRALEEIVYAYAWALKHASTLLGSTAKKVIFVGDSAGGTLNLGAALKCLQLNIRKPDGIFLAYTPVLLTYVSSPSRILFHIDTILLFGFIMRCSEAYTGLDNKKITEKPENEECFKLDIESTAEMDKNEFTALHPNKDSMNSTSKLASPTSDSTLNAVSVHGQNNKLWSRFKQSLGRRSNKNVRQLDTKNAKTIVEEITMPEDLFMSPYFASDDMLAQLPPMKIMTTEFDPCLDDCIMFARKLRSLDNKVTLDILPGLPHGFFYFLRVSKEAMEGVKFSANRIKELLEL